jgi:hypothetical protein
MECPQDIKNRARILFYNGFKGFQPPEEMIGPNIFVICWCSDDLTLEQVDKIKEISGTNTLKHGDYLGRGYMEIRWDEHHKISTIFNSMLQLGHWFRTNNKGNAGFNPEKGDNQFTFDLMEKKIVIQNKELFSLNPSLITSDVYCNPWNYSTTEGLAFCYFLREKKQMSPIDYNNKANYFNWPIFQNYDQNTLQTINSSPVIIVESISLELEDSSEMETDDNNESASQLEDSSEMDPDDDNEPTSQSSDSKLEESSEMEIDDKITECMICFDRPPNTMVLPCEHCVVCKECSIGLKNTNDHHTCVRCRRRITHILE